MLGRKFVLFSTRTSCFQKLLKTCQKVYSTNNSVDVLNEKKKHRKITENISVSSAARNYLKDAGLEYYMNYIPKHLLRKQCVPTSKLYLFDIKTAKKLSLMISEDLIQNSCFVIECNPGLGFLSQELLKIGVPCIHLYEKLSCFYDSQSPLGKLIMEHKERLDLRKLNFSDVWLTLLRDKHNFDDLADIYLTDMPYHAWKNNTFAQIIIFCPSRKFLSLLIHNFFHQTKLFEHGRATFFLILPLDIWMRAKVDNKTNKNMNRYYNQYSVFLHLFFEFKLLGELPREAFVPWPKKKQKNKINEIDVPMQVIQLEPKSNTFDLISPEDLRLFWYFLKHCMRSRNTSVIQEMEKWIPGCGPRLIALNIDILTKFKELSPAKLFEIFKHFRTWPEYDENFFVELTGSCDIKKQDDEKSELEEIETESEMQDEFEQDSDARHSSVI